MRGAGPVLSPQGDCDASASLRRQSLRYQTLKVLFGGSFLESQKVIGTQSSVIKAVYVLAGLREKRVVLRDGGDSNVSVLNNGRRRME